MCKVIEEEAGFHVETDFPDFGDSTRHFVNYWEHGVASEEWHMNKIYNAVLKGIKKGWDIKVRWPFFYERGCRIRASRHR